jgi:hypothetical protein
MPADLDQFGRDNSHRTIIGRKSLVKLGHGTADGCRFLDQVYVVAGISQVQGGLHPADAAAENHNRSYGIRIVRFHGIFLSSIFYPGCRRFKAEIRQSRSAACSLPPNKPTAKIKKDQFLPHQLEEVKDNHSLLNEDNSNNLHNLNGCELFGFRN